MTKLVVDTVTLDTHDSPVVRLAGTFAGAAPDQVILIGARQRLAAPTDVAGDRWSASVPLIASRWGGAPMPGAAGRYRLHGDSVAVRASLPEPILLPDVAEVQFAITDTLELKLSAPLGVTERGPKQQARLEAEYHAARPEPMNAIFFESFYGQNVSCNPRALDRAFARLRPDLPRYWSVADASIEVPEGAIQLIEGSAEWWRVRAAARLLIVNDWLRNRYRKRAYQTVLQTWHGTPLKRIALSRRGLRVRPMLATLRERSRWSVMLSQNEHSTRIFRRAYAFFGPIWQEGYPRDDVLLTGNPASVRSRLGIDPGKTVLLYAPTWRDDRPDEVDHLDAARFAAELGDDYVVLVRGHARTLQPGADVRGNNVIDVTSYPDVSELFVVADVLITDYSSVMFDYTVTGKPVLFFTPDLEHYRDELRGFYFDLAPVAPGPIARTTDELLDLVRGRDAVAAHYAEKYRVWQQRFNPDDDGRAADRVVAKLIDRGVFGA
ncbi:CDP-glycerol glycerophosphotransferase family protein [Diaminobutyricimonas sp. LJ205]|uniref:CDP-glycerol glycerophosphotransferase family protein n=1 Tax=Diaminobutyricimonas sp. LJ205 TaxID=2683590 RepID=UPI0012F525F0|nr:CDP-glycerol glycerophosphotransferase family protein [Diaminobutyricimonas sp. LJ205]